jgi:hypothetical protein
MAEKSNAEKWVSYLSAFDLSALKSTEKCVWHVLNIAHVEDRLFVARDTDLVESNSGYANPLFFDTLLQSHTES